MRRLTALTALLLLPTALASAQDDGGFTPLVEGTDAGQFDLVGIDADTITISPEGEVALSGTPNGYFATKEGFDDYTLRFEWMYERPDDLRDDAAFDGNSGLLIHIEGEAKVWPRCIEVQLKNSDAGRLLGVSGGKIQGDRPAQAVAQSRAEAIKPVGQWNAMEVVCRDGAVACSLNGTLIDTGTAASPESGPIGFQSEGRPIRFRSLEIRPIE
ncbi:3-keto-disaccharide hydrolase [Tautonia plasticadhaerens]|uniref:3-keto-alpha-glucoside-1,2-lyase/3-keto-2-hydroxy-glucal hydratase domain-containing protein n=1 Tax=Tautonia plasticadhaerens TaxID=2527974 RepID=A0A518H3F9_9BACT|nr:DUF1080 domain-containing protein [Tautonia plasticadhaerens]QDV35363.1 hypothetical protein ElP_32660 [Tautonia plasticadhaerens]